MMHKPRIDRILIVILCGWLIGAGDGFAQNRRNPPPPPKSPSARTAQPRPRVAPRPQANQARPPKKGVRRRFNSAARPKPRWTWRSVPPSKRGSRGKFNAAARRKPRIPLGKRPRNLRNGVRRKGVLTQIWKNSAHSGGKKAGKTGKKKGTLTTSQRRGLTTIKQAREKRVKVEEVRGRRLAGRKRCIALMSASQKAPKGGISELGRALEKHANRSGRADSATKGKDGGARPRSQIPKARITPTRGERIWGKIKGDNQAKHVQALRHFREIESGPGRWKLVRTGSFNFIEKRLPDGRGIRLNMDYTFKGFVD